MKITIAVLIVFTMIFEILESHRTSAERRFPRSRSRGRYNRNSSILLSSSDKKCAEVNVTFSNGIRKKCINGVLNINGKDYKNIKLSDDVEVTFNELRVNNTVVEKIAPYGTKVASNSFPQIVGSFPETVGSFPKTVGSFPKTVGSFPKTGGSFPKTGGKVFNTYGTTNSFNKTDDDDDEHPLPSINCSGCNGINPYWKNGKFYINGVEIKNFKVGDELSIVQNKVYVNGDFKCSV